MNYQASLYFGEYHIRAGLITERKLLEASGPGYGGGYKTSLQTPH